MALSDLDRATIRRLSGPFPDEDEADIEAAIARLGSARLAALEIMLVARVEMDRSASKLGGGRNTSDHTANLARMDARIAELVAAIMNDPDEVLSEAAEDLLDEAVGGSLESTTSIRVVARATRRG